MTPLGFFYYLFISALVFQGAGHVAAEPVDFSSCLKWRMLSYSAYLVKHLGSAFYFHSDLFGQ